MRGIPVIVGLMWVAGMVLPASAGTLYRCIGGDGIPHYAQSRVAGARCEVVSRYTPQRNVPPSPVAATPAASTSVSASAPVPATASAEAARPATGGTATGTGTRVVSGQVYSYLKDGVRHYSSVPPSGTRVAALRTIRYRHIETCYACGNPGLNFAGVRLNTTAYQDEIARAAREFGVEESVVRAIIHAESAYRPTAVSRVGAQGLMQLMPATAQRFGVEDAFDAGQNIRGGVQYLAWLLKRYRGDLTLAAAGYNAGEGAVDRHGGVPPYRETRQYVQRVALLADRYRGALAASI